MREQEGHIGFVEGLALGYAVLTIKTLIEYPAFLIDTGATAAWQIALVSMLAALVVFWPTAHLLRRFPGMGLGGIAEKAAGPFGSLLTLGVAAYLGVLGALTTRMLAEGFIISILPETPPSVLVLGFVLCAVAASHKGIEVLGRTAVILMPLGILLLGGLILLNWNHVRWDWLYPLWGHGAQTTLVQGLLHSGSFADVTTLLACGYAFRSQGTAAKSSGIAILLSGLTIAAVTLTCLTAYGYREAASLPFPSFTLAQSIYLGRFFQRVESIFVMVGFFSGAICLSLLFHALVSLITEVLRLPYHRPLIFPLAILWFTGALIPSDFRVVVTGLQWLHSGGGVPVLCFPLLLLLLTLLRRKGRGETHVA